MDLLGFNIGTRLADELLAKLPLSSTEINFRSGVEEVVRPGMQLAFGVKTDVKAWGDQYKMAVLSLENNLLTRFVTFPTAKQVPQLCQLFCGIIRGVLRQLSLDVSCVCSWELNAELEMQIRVMLKK